MENYRYAKARAFIISIAVLLVFLLVPSMLTAFFSSAALVFTKSMLTELSSQLLTASGFILSLFLIILRYKKGGRPINEIVGIYPRKFLQLNTLYFLIAGLLLGTAVSCGLNLLPKFIISSYGSKLNIVDGGLERLVWLLTIIIITPVAEEIVFRRFILGAICEAFVPKVGIIVSALVFGILHVQVIWILYAFAMGLLLGKLAVENGDLTYSISTHLGFNASSLPILLLKPESATYKFLFGSSWQIAMCFLITAVCGAFLIFKLLTKTNNTTTVKEATPA